MPSGPVAGLLHQIDRLSSVAGKGGVNSFKIGGGEQRRRFPDQVYSQFSMLTSFIQSICYDDHLFAQATRVFSGRLGEGCPKSSLSSLVARRLWKSHDKSLLISKTSILGSFRKITNTLQSLQVPRSAPGVALVLLSFLYP